MDADVIDLASRARRPRDPGDEPAPPRRARAPRPQRTEIRMAGTGRLVGFLVPSNEPADADPPHDPMEA